MSERCFQLVLIMRSFTRGVIPGGAGGATAPQLLANNTFFGFSHTTDRKVPSEVVLMGSFMSVRYGNVRFVQLKISRIMILINIGGLRGGHLRHANVEMMCICLGFGCGLGDYIHH